jgi:RNA 3'-terminal phosphate cyclase (ATP)
MITLDGSQGEGGGQILRSALALSLVTGRPFRITRIRARRPKPGLMRQHVACMEAAARIGSATVDGAGLGSTELTFEPGAVAPGTYEFKIGSAGSTMLLLQTILPPLLLAEGPSEVTLEGGTHNPFAPPFPFIEQAFLPLLRRIGFRVEAVLQNPGFYPNGGGRCWISIEPVERRSPTRLGQDDACNRAGSQIGAPELRRLELGARTGKPAIPSPLGGERDRERGSASPNEESHPLTPALSPDGGEGGGRPDLSATVHLAGLPRAVAERELSVVQRRLGIAPDRCSVIEAPDAFGPGNTVHIHAALDGYAEVFSGFGAPKVRAEQVANAAADEAETFLRSGAAVGEHLADQLLLPLALARGGRFVTTEPSSHTRTNIAVIQEFLDTKIEAEQIGPELWKIRVEPR